MEFHFVRIQRGGYSMITDPRQTPRIICFKTPECANKYVGYLTMYRSKFGLWPSINLGQPVTKVRVNPEFKKRTPDEVMKYVFTEVRDREDLDKMSRTTGLSFFYCHDFVYDENMFMTVNLRGQEIDGVADHSLYIDRLESNIKNV